MPQKQAPYTAPWRPVINQPSRYRRRRTSLKVQQSLQRNPQRKVVCRKNILSLQGKQQIYFCTPSTEPPDRNNFTDRLIVTQVFQFVQTSYKRGSTFFR